MDVSIKTTWVKTQTGPQFKGYFVEIVFQGGSVATADAQKLYIDDKPAEPDFDYLYVEAKKIVVSEVAETVWIYTR